MASELVETTLGRVCTSQGGSISTGPFGSQLHASDYSDAGTPVVMPVNLINGRVSESGIARVGDEHVLRLSRHRLRPGDIVFSRRGDVTRFALVSERESGWLCGTGCLKISLGSVKTATPEFIAAYLSSPDAKDWLVRHAVGATMPNLNTEILSDIPIILPQLADQAAIGGFLTSIDQRVELIRQTNATLEAIAQALFKSWFVDFDPVRAKAEGREPEGMDAETAALFPSEFEESELGLIPKGWLLGRLGDYCHNVRSQARPQDLQPETEYIGLEHMPRGSIAPTETGRAAGLASGKFWYQRGDVLFGKLRPYFHKVIVAANNGVCSTDILVVRAKEPVFFGFAAMHLSSRSVIEHATQVSNGAKMPRCNWGDLDGFPVVAPPREMLSAFDELARPIVDAIHSNIRRTDVLSVLRDTLLPRLISGKLRLPEAEATIEESLA